MEYEKYREAKIVRYLDSIKNNWRKFPVSLQVALTDKCFNKCIMCGHWRRENKHTLSVHALMRFLNIGYHKGLETVCYSGGDPFAYGAGDLDGLLKFHQKYKIPYGFITSGYIPKKLIPLIPDIAKAEWIRVSLDATIPDIYKKCRGGVSSVGVLQSVRMLVDADAFVGFGITVSRHNIYHVPDVIDLGTNFGIKEIRLWIVRENPDLTPDEKGLEVLRDKLERIWIPSLDRHGISHNLSTVCKTIVDGEEAADLDFDRCMACRLQLFIGADGRIFPCCIIAGDTEDRTHGVDFGTIHTFRSWEKTWAEIFNFSEYGKLPPICRRNCITRLSTVNHYAEKMLLDKNFI